MKTAEFNNKWIVITGASQGLGRVCAEYFANLGAKLILVARNEERLQEVCSNCLNSENHRWIAADLTDKDEIEKVIAKVAHITNKEIKTLVHTAGGGYGKTQPLIEYDDYLLLFKVNLLSVSELNRYIIPWMQKSNEGNIIHVGSVASTEATGSVGYNSIKTALAAYVRTLGREYAVDNIVVTGILPGGFTAPDNAMVRLQNRNPEFYQKFIDQRLPRGYMGEASELMELIRFLSSSQASMMGGCMVPIDAGEGLSYYVE